MRKHPFHGPIHHLGYVVEDLEEAVQRLVSELGAGPFFVVRDVSFELLTSPLSRVAAWSSGASGSARSNSPVAMSNVPGVIDLVAGVRAERLPQRPALAGQSLPERLGADVVE